MNPATEPARRRLGGRTLVMVLALVVAGLDQLIKAWVREALAVGERIEATSSLALTHVENRGFAFSAFSDAGSVVVVVSVIVAALLLVILARIPLTNSAVVAGLGLLAGGAVGNLIDRVGSGYVTDFVAVGSFPRFNFADAAITVGVVLVIVGQLMSERRLAHSGSGASGESADS